MYIDRVHVRHNIFVFNIHQSKDRVETGIYLDTHKHTVREEFLFGVVGGWLWGCGYHGVLWDWVREILTTIPQVNVIPRPQYVFGTISPYPTHKKVMAVSHMEFSKFECSSSWNLKLGEGIGMVNTMCTKVFHLNRVKWSKLN